ncbi:MAG: hypothetical protein ABW049_12850 [Spongiibacteraceae bacterium]
MSALDQLMSLIDRVDCYNNPPENLRELQLVAAQERLDQRRSQVAVLDKRAREAGIDKLKSFDDLVPLLFSHTNYKSYPDNFVTNGRWDMMNLWLQTLSTKKITGVNTQGIKDVDDWLDRLRDAGHYVFASSGTSGKASFLNQTEVDHERTYKGYLNQILWQVPSLKPNRDRPYFCSVPRYSAHRFTEINVLVSQAIGKPDEIMFLTDIPTKAADTNRMGAMRTRIADGTATPEEIAQFEAESKRKAALMEESVNKYYDAILDNRHRPIFIISMWQYVYYLAERGRARGIPDGTFNLDTAVMIGGGLKGANLPPDFQDSAMKFLGIPLENVAQSYGMVEMQAVCPYSRQTGGYVTAPWVIPLILDKAGEKLLNPKQNKGVVEGRMAFLDLSIEGRWGGVITGDKVHVDFNKHPTITGPFVQSITRYKDLPEGDDKLNCAGTIDSYVRGSIDA